VNQANDVGEANGVARKIQTVAREFLAVELDSLGYVPLDRSVGKAIRGQVPLLLAYPSSPAALRIVDLARRLAPEPAHVKESGSAIITLLKRLASASGGLGRA
jgi:flagellar biosynthesis protein FlhG